MANEVINLGTVFSGFDSGTDLQPKNTRTNNQGVKIEDIAGFIKNKNYCWCSCFRCNRQIWCLIHLTQKYISVKQQTLFVATAALT